MKTSKKSPVGLTENKIRKGNKLIAEFIGRYKKNEDITKYEDDIIIDIKYDGFSGSERKRITRAFDYTDLKYHSSWDWLMPVIDKIEKIGETEESYGGNVDISSHYIKISASISNPMGEKTIFKQIVKDQKRNEYSTKIEGAFKAIVEFIEVLNKNEETK